MVGQTGGSDSKESVCNAGDPGFDPWVGKIPWRKNGFPPSILAWRVPWTEEPGLASQRHPGKFPKVPGRRRGTRGFPAVPEKDLESPSSMRLEALVPSRDSRARTRSPLRHQCTHTFTVAGRPRRLQATVDVLRRSPSPTLLSSVDLYTCPTRLFPNHGFRYIITTNAWAGCPNRS